MLEQIDAVLRLIDREVWIVTASDGTRRGGLTATWVAPASIDAERPVLLAALAPNHFTTEVVLSAGGFAAHLLREDQTEIAWNFARDTSRQRDKFAELALAQDGQPPLLADCLAWCKCQVFATYHAGDRLLFWADVLAAGKPGSGHPLREQALIRALSPGQRQRLQADRMADIATQRPLHEQWRQLASQLGSKPV